MLAVVAEKTGYPADMLNLGMDLEGDLGIDSIKRVEILSAVADQVPDLRSVDMGHMGSLRTLGAIVDYMKGLGPKELAAPPQKRTAISDGDLQALMLAVVAEKTGYPADMLNLGMDLEGDLGIDSIKRVEILSAVADQVPDLRSVDMGHMGSLRTLGAIVDYMKGLGQPGLATPAAAPAAAPRRAARSDRRLRDAGALRRPHRRWAVSSWRGSRPRPPASPSPGSWAAARSGSPVRSSWTSRWPRSCAPAA